MEKNETKIKKRKEIVVLNKRFNKDTELLEIGIDEVGRGPMFGRVYTAAVILPKNDIFKFEILKDSKKFSSKKKINEAANYIKENALFWSVSWCDEKDIDKINIRNSTHKSMHQSIQLIITKFKQVNKNTKLYEDTVSFNKLFYLLIDGNDFKPYTYVNEKTNTLESINHVLVEGGDNKYCSIAAASILAKVERDAYIDDICDKFKKLNTLYGLEKNKGYGTSQHLEGIKIHGISPWHRTTFGLCKTAKKNQEDFYL